MGWGGASNARRWACGGKPKGAVFFSFFQWAPVGFVLRVLCVKGCMWALCLRVDGQHVACLLCYELASFGPRWVSSVRVDDRVLRAQCGAPLHRSHLHEVGICGPRAGALRCALAQTVTNPDPTVHLVDFLRDTLLLKSVKVRGRLRCILYMRATYLQRQLRHKDCIAAQPVDHRTTQHGYEQQGIEKNKR
jgi:hypothetical protein